MNRIQGLVESVEGSSGILSVSVLTPAGRIEALLFGTAGGVDWLAVGLRVEASFKESDAMVAPSGSFPWEGAFPGVVAAMSGSEILCRIDVDCGGSRLSALVPARRLESMGIGPGSAVDVWASPHEVVLEGLDP